MRPAGAQLLVPLQTIYNSGDPTAKKLATSAMLAYAATRADVLGEMTLTADDEQFRQFMSAVRVCVPQIVNVMRRELAVQTGDLDLELEKERIAKRQANAATCLLRLGEMGYAWPILVHSQDARVRTYLIHQFVPQQVDAEVFIDRWDQETDNSVRSALLQIFGEYADEQLSAVQRRTIGENAKREWLENNQPGVHSSAEWWLRSHVELDFIEKNAAKLEERIPRVGSWYRAPAGQTMVVLDGTTEVDIGRYVAVATMEVSRRQMEEFRPAHPFDTEDHPTVDCPAGVVTWFDAVMYCQWLNEQESIPLINGAIHHGAKSRARGRQSRRNWGRLDTAYRRMPSGSLPAELTRLHPGSMARRTRC
jgi:acyl carrier protein phosphodiesterase